MKIEVKMEVKNRKDGKRKGKEKAKDSILTGVTPPVIQEDTEMKDISASSDGYEDLSHYEDEGEAWRHPLGSPKKTYCQMSGSKASW